LVTKSLVTPSYHIVAEVGFFERVFVQSELTFIKKGYKIKYDDILPGLSDFLDDTKDVYNYIEIPVLIKFDINDDPETDLQFYLGPTFGFLSKRTIEGTNFFGEEIVGAKETILESDIGGVLGVTARGKAGPGKLYIDLRLGTGFSNFMENEGLEISNQWTNIMVGYMYPLIGG
ncbi:MAG: outer membrane beta-barrel protein, partial [Phaeodactylibacter sp.]|nr:outer membrane beta-barrel protein [Phaeodactylibacter sp.]